MVPIIAYYTSNSSYENDAIVLKENLDALKLKHDIHEFPCAGSWQANTQLKANFIRQWMENNPDVPYFVYLDVDALVIKQPIWFDQLAEQNTQFAAVIFNNSVLLSGTLFFANNKTTRDLVDDWIALNKKYPTTLPDGREAWDQRTLHMAVKSKLKKGVDWVEMPLGYTFMIGLTQTRYPDITDPVIVHTRGHLRYGE